MGEGGGPDQEGAGAVSRGTGAAAASVLAFTLTSLPLALLVYTSMTSSRPLTSPGSAWWAACSRMGCCC